MNDVMTTTEAAQRWKVTAQTVKLACSGQKGYPPRFMENECNKSGGTWLVTRQGMERLFGPEKNDWKGGAEGSAFYFI